jgi:hypothetical protein
MLTISDEALAMIELKNEPIFLDMPKTITSCCFDFQDCPTVRFGVPKNVSCYDKETIRDIPVYIPHRLPENPLEIAVANFLGLKRLVIKGWKLI